MVILSENDWHVLQNQNAVLCGWICLWKFDSLHHLCKMLNWCDMIFCSLLLDFSEIKQFCKLEQRFLDKPHVNPYILHIPSLLITPAGPLISRVNPNISHLLLITPDNSHSSIYQTLYMMFVRCNYNACAMLVRGVCNVCAMSPIGELM